MQRLYIDSRDRAGGSNEDFEISLPHSINVERESVAVLDTVLIPNSFFTVTEDVDDRIYIKEDDFSGQRYRIAKVAPGYYHDLDSFARAVQEALNDGRLVLFEYSVTYEARSGRFRIWNQFKGEGENAIIWSRESLQRWPPTVGEEPLFPDFDRHDLKDAYRQLGVLYGSSPHTDRERGINSMTMNQTPNLHTHNNLFIKGNLGVPGACFGPGGSMDILRRVVMQAPLLSKNFDNHGTHYDNIRIPPGTINTLRFRLCGFDGKLVDLQGQPWSFSLVIYPA